MQVSPITFRCIADVIHQNQLIELKFVSELPHAMFLQFALYLGDE